MKLQKVLSGSLQLLKNNDYRPDFSIAIVAIIIAISNSMGRRINCKINADRKFVIVRDTAEHYRTHIKYSG